MLTHLASNATTSVSAAGQLAMSSWNPFAAARVARLARDFAPDVAHIHNTWFATTVSAVRALSRLGIPTVVTLHNYRLICNNGLLLRDQRICTDCVGSHPWHGVAHRCYRNSFFASAASSGAIRADRSVWLSHVDLFLALTDFARDLFIQSGIPSHKINVKPNFVATPGDREIPASASRRVLMVGRLSPEKGADFGIELWNRVAPAGLELIVVGDGPLRQRLERRGDRSVTFLRHRPRSEVFALMKSARALLFPTRFFEGMPTVLLEAMACGLPVLASDMPPIVETLGPVVRTAQPDDFEEWADLVRLLDDDTWIEQTSSAAVELHRARFTPTKALEGLVDAYHRAQSARAAADSM